MTHERDIERLLDTWFSDGPTETPDRVIDTVADRIARQPQRPAWRLTWRHHPMNAYLKPLALVAATILVAFLGFNLVGGFKTNSDVAAPSPHLRRHRARRQLRVQRRRARSSPARWRVRRATTTTPGRAPGSLAAGDHASANLVTSLQLHGPEGWVEHPRHRSHLHPGDERPGSRRRSQVMAKIAIAEQNSDVQPDRRGGCRRLVQDIVDFVATHPGLDTTDPVPVEVGGYKGQSIDLTVASTWTTTCREPPRARRPAADRHRCACGA